MSLVISHMEVAPALQTLALVSAFALLTRLVNMAVFTIF